MLVVVAVFLTGCERAATQAERPITAASEIGRWQVVPASAQAVMSSGTPFFFAWRIDSKTGALELCTYNTGGYLAVAKAATAEALECFAAPKVPAQ
jgi:hypothetical protein